MVDQMMARLQVDEDERTATATQHATELASAHQANATMEPHMQTLLSQVQAIQLAKTPNHGSNYGHICSCGCRRGRGHGRARPSALLTLKYCWTHGNCGNSSEEFTYPANEHKKEVPFSHMMSSSTYRCYNITK